MKRFASFACTVLLTPCLLAGCGLFTEKTPAAPTTAATAAPTTQETVAVTVKNGDAAQTLSLPAGSTVEQALASAGVDLQLFTPDAAYDAAVFDGMVINLTPVHEDGFAAEDDRTYYYRSGVRVTNAVVGSDEEGYYYTGSDGAIDFGYCDGVEVDGTDWNVINGRATPAWSESDLTLNRALKVVAQCTVSSMTKEEKLRAAFDYLKTAYLEGVRHDPPYREMDWPIVYANDIFVYGKGDCFSYGAAFAFMGKAIGCGECCACNSGGHGWAEIEGLVYDPEWDMHHPEFDHFAVDYYDNPTDVNYRKGIAPGADYMRVAV